MVHVRIVRGTEARMADARSSTIDYRTVPQSTVPHTYTLMRARPLRLVRLACRRSQSISSGCGLNCATASPGVARIQLTNLRRGMHHGEAGGFGEAACTRLVPGCARALSNGQLQATAGFHAGCGYRAVGDTMPTGYHVAGGRCRRGCCTRCHSRPTRLTQMGPPAGMCR